MRFFHYNFPSLNAATDKSLVLRRVRFLVSGPKISFFSHSLLFLEGKESDNERRTEVGRGNSERQFNILRRVYALRNTVS